MIRSRVVALCAIGLFAGLLWFGGESASAGWIRYASLASLGAVVLEATYERWLWAFVSIGSTRLPDLRGTWRGTLKTHWIDPESGQSPPPKTCYLVINQSASTIQSTFLTDESRSSSSIASASRDGSGTLLRYLYFNHPQIEFDYRSRAHNGAGVLHVDSTAEALEGHYWTDRNSRGELLFEQRNRKRAATFSEAESLMWTAPTPDPTDDS